LHKIAAMEQKINHEEIDLLKLLAKCFRHIQKNWVIVLIFPLLGAAVGYLISMDSGEKFESKMMIRSEVLSVTECDFLLKQLELSKSLPVVTPEEHSTLLRLYHEMYSSEPAYAEITIQVNNIETLGVLQSSILEFLENSEYARKKKEELKNFHTVMISRIDHELKLLDDVKTHTAYEAQASALKPSDLFTSSVELTEKKIEYEQKLKNEQLIVVVDGFARVVSEAKMPLTLLLLLGVLSGGLIAIIVLFIKYFITYYNRYRKTESV
jgi:hypothetical protein